MPRKIQVSLSPRCIIAGIGVFFSQNLYPLLGQSCHISACTLISASFHHHLVHTPISASPITVSAYPIWPLPPEPRRASSRPAGLLSLHFISHPAQSSCPTQALFPLSRLEKSRGEPKKKEDFSLIVAHIPGPAKRFPEVINYKRTLLNSGADHVWWKDCTAHATWRPIIISAFSQQETVISTRLLFLWTLYCQAQAQ